MLSADAVTAIKGKHAVCFIIGLNIELIHNYVAKGTIEESTEYAR